MARDQEPMTDEEIADFEAAMDEQAGQLRKDLGGEPEDYRRKPVADGGDH